MNALRLDITQLIGRDLVRPGQRYSGSFAWPLRSNGAQAPVYAYTADLTDPENAWFRLQLIAASPADQAVSAQRIRLTTTVPEKGGLRWWFICPMTGKRARVLYRPTGTPRFASRHAYDLAYFSQRQTRADRIMDKARAARRKLGVDAVDLLEMPVWPKPKGMHWRTYGRLLADIEALRRAVWATAPL